MKEFSRWPVDALVEIGRDIDQGQSASAGRRATGLGHWW